MAHQALTNLLAHRQAAARQLAAEILDKYREHLATCEKQGRMSPFSLYLTGNAEDEVIEEALKLCAEHTDRTGNSVTAGYVWLDSANPDILKQLEELAEDVATWGILTGILAAVSVVVPPVGLSLLALQFIAPFPAKYRDPHIVMFAPSAIRAHLRTPVRVYNIVNGHVNTFTSTFTDVASHAYNIGTQAAGLAGQATTTTVTDLASQGLGLISGFFGRKSP